MKPRSLYKKVLRANAADEVVVCATQSEDGDAFCTVAAPCGTHAVLLDCQVVMDVYRALGEAYGAMVKAEAGTLSYQPAGVV
jgi:hypothetical protein